MAKNLTEMAAGIATAQASHAGMSLEEMEEFLKKTFLTLKGLRAMEEGGPIEQLSSLETQAELIDPKKSIQKNKVICLECNKGFRVLTSRHMQDHGMDMKEYRKKYGFSARQPLSAKSLSAQRRKVAKESRLGEKAQKARKAKGKK